MGFFTNIFNKIRGRGRLKYMKMLNNNYPIFSQFGTDIYASDVVQQAIYCIVTEMKKLNPRHVRKTSFDLEPVEGDLQSVLSFPNNLMTCSDFIEKITWLTMLNYNCFIYIRKDKLGRVLELWPLNPSSVSFLTDQKDRMFLHRAILSTLELNHALLEGVRKALNTSFAINGVIKYNTMLDDGKMKRAIEEFEDKVRKSESGFLPIDLKAEIVPMSRDIKLVDSDTLRFVDSKILRHFGVPLSILEGDYTTEQYAAFYQRTLEPLIITFSEAFTKALFTDREKKGFNNKVIFFPSELVFMNIDQTLQMVHELGQSGTLFENEKRAAFGLQPLKELIGIRLQSLNYVDVSIVKDYQLGNAGLAKVALNGSDDYLNDYADEDKKKKKIH